MREIKFRAWDGKRMLFMGKGGDCGFELAGGEIFTLTEFEAHKQDYPLMQYTGLKDKNGVEIYEGDIVLAISCFDAECDDEERRYQISWGESAWVFKGERQWKDGIHDWSSIENCETFKMKVIGNIFENPELLESKRRVV